MYVNLVGGQDELVFDGGSMVMDAHGASDQRAPFFAEGLYPVDFTLGRGGGAGSWRRRAGIDRGAAIYQALVLGVRDYVSKNGFPGAVVGLSGGIDSALTLAIAVDALGAERVDAVMMPSRYTADMSKTPAPRPRRWG